jgi:mannose-1-phosphate guanylyltransferase
VRASFDWSDVGSWSAVAKLTGSNSESLVTAEAEGTFVHSSSGRRIIVVGFDNAAIIESADGLLVLNMAKADALSDAVRKIG